MDTTNTYLRAAQKIQKKMQEKGITQTQLASQVGVSDAFLSKFFKHGNKITLELFEKILNVLGYDLLEFSEKKTTLNAASM